MTPEGFKRKLTAILSADAVGYSRLMAEDETATVKTLATYREVMTSLIKQHRGRVVDSPGDNVLAEFSSVVDAVQCAVAVQNEFQTRNAELAENRRMEFRIGINLGDVIDEEDRIYGDGVNVAARLEALADPNGICVSKTAFDQIETKLPLGYEYLGEQSVKNIPKPIGAYRVLMKPDAAGKVIGEKRFSGRYSRRIAMATILILVIVAGGLIGWNIYLHQSKKIEPASVDKMAFPLPDKPSIAVLPFTNLSDDSGQAFLSDGITEDIITSLSKVPDLFVIARNSTFTYKGKSVKVQQVAEELGVRYVLEGGLQRSGDTVRITVQLIDAITGSHVWAERYDRELKDIFALQDEITMKLITSLQVKLTVGSYARVMARGTTNIEAYLKLLQVRKHWSRLTKEDNLLARQMAKEVIALDPKYPSGHLFLAWTHFADGVFGWSKSRKESMDLAEKLCQKALELDNSLSMPHNLLSRIYDMRMQKDKSIPEGELAVFIDPNPPNMYSLALNLKNAGRHEESIAWWEKAFRLDPIPPAYSLHGAGNSYFLEERYTDALTQYKRLLDRVNKGEYNPLFAHLHLAQTYVMLGQEKEAQEHVAEVLKLKPKYSIKRYANTLARFYKNQADRDHLINALRKAGLPE
jgi:adenylate cyclase